MCRMQMEHQATHETGIQRGKIYLLVGLSICVWLLTLNNLSTAYICKTHYWREEPPAPLGDTDRIRCAFKLQIMFRGLFLNTS
jgi:hypothetical protein